MASVVLWLMFAPLLLHFFSISAGVCIHTFHTCAKSSWETLSCPAGYAGYAGCKFAEPPIKHIQCVDRVQSRDSRGRSEWTKRWVHWVHWVLQVCQAIHGTSNGYWRFVWPSTWSFIMVSYRPLDSLDSMILDPIAFAINIHKLSEYLKAINIALLQFASICYMRRELLHEFRLRLVLLGPVARALRGRQRREDKRLLSDVTRPTGVTSVTIQMSPNLSSNC